MLIRVFCLALASATLLADHDTDLAACADRLRLHAGSETVFITKPSGEIVTVSGNPAGLLGYSEADLIGQPLSALTATADEATRFLADAAFPPTEIVRMRWVRKKRDFVEIEVLSAERLPGGQRMFLVRASHGAVSGLRFLQASLDVFPLPLTVLDGAGRVVASNARWRALHAAEVPAGISLGESLAGDRQTFQMVYQCPAGWYLAYGGRFELDGTPYTLVAHQSMEEEDARRAEVVNRILGRFAHHFNNLFTVITGQLELISMHMTSEHPARAFVSVSQDASQAAIALVADLQTVIRGRVSTKPEIELAGSIRDFVKGKLRVAFTGPETPVWVRADKVQIQRVIDSLLSNAHRAMPEGDVRVTLAVDGESATITVADRGVGMDEATQRRLFQPFFTTEPIGSVPTGLSLAVARGILLAHNGTITVQSIKDVGTTVTVRLPKVPRPTITITGGAPPSPNAIRVLIVDDDNAVRSVTAALLSRMGGYEVIQSASGADALTKLDGITIVLSDVGMPGMNGVELARRIQAAKPGLKIVLYSGYPGEMRQLLADAGINVNGTLAKPYTPTRLDETLRAALR